LLCRHETVNGITVASVNEVYDFMSHVTVSFFTLDAECCPFVALTSKLDL